VLLAFLFELPSNLENNNQIYKSKNKLPDSIQVNRPFNKS
jgi:hypothetical protein